MSEVKLVIRDVNEDRSGIVHGSVADCVIAALSADPVSITELDAAVDRFTLESPVRGHFPHFRHRLDTEPWDAGLVVIDLAARLVVIDSTYSTPRKQGIVTRCNVANIEGGQVHLRYRMSDEWMFLSEATNWQGIARIRRQQQADQPEIDLHEIFYGEPMLRFIINGCRKQFAHRDEIAKQVRLEWIERRRRWNVRFATETQPDPESLTMHDLAHEEDPTEDIEHRIYYGTIRDIHADWLMTPCPELNDQLPRAVMLRDRDRLSGDMSDREDQWSILERCPPGISPESHAFQFSGFNTNEIVMYYDYVREVAWSCWDRLRTMSDDELKSLAAPQTAMEEFTRAEVKRLREVGDDWLDAPWDEDPMRTPRGIINLERRRQPNGGQFHPIDPDCSCCQELAAMPGIGFWHMDGCNMDDLFAFGYHYDTIEEWEKNQEDYRELSDQMDEEWKLAKEWNLPPQFSEPSAEFDDVWRMVVKEADGEIPLGQRLNRVGHEAISVIVQFRIAAKHDSDFAVEPYIETLQIEFAQLQQACDKSTNQKLSPDVEPNVTRLLDSVDELIFDVNRYAGINPEDTEPEDESEADFAFETGEPPLANQAEASVDARPARDFRWGKVSHKARELRRVLLSFTDISEKKSSGDWYPDDIPF
jgi:hypothetical protein